MRRGFPDPPAARELSVFVVGIGYPNRDKSNRQFEVAMCKPGEPVELRREPKNPADPNGVAVYSARGTQIGYLPAERAPWIGGKLAQGQPIRAVFQEGGDRVAVIRINMAGDEPTLPPAKGRGVGDADTHEEPPEDRFWPDPEPPDDFD